MRAVWVLATIALGLIPAVARQVPDVRTPPAGGRVRGAAQEEALGHVPQLQQGTGANGAVRRDGHHEPLLLRGQHDQFRRQSLLRISACGAASTAIQPCVNASARSRGRRRRCRTRRPSPRCCWWRISNLQLTGSGVHSLNYLFLVTADEVHSRLRFHEDG